MTNGRDKYIPNGEPVAVDRDSGATQVHRVVASTGRARCRRDGHHVVMPFVTVLVHLVPRGVRWCTSASCFAGKAPTT